MPITDIQALVEVTLLTVREMSIIDIGHACRLFDMDREQAEAFASLSILNIKRLAASSDVFISPKEMHPETLKKITMANNETIGFLPGLIRVG